MRPAVDFNRLEEVLVVTTPPARCGRRRRRERRAGIALVIAIALALQTTLARFLTPGARSRRPRVRGGRLHRAQQRARGRADCRGDGRPGAGCAGGHRACRAIAIGAGVVTTRSIIGIGGLAKTVVGFVTGIVGSQFIVARPLPRAFVFFTATVAHAIIFVGLYRVMDPGIRRQRLRRDSQPGRRQRAGGRAGLSDLRYAAGLRRSPAIDGRRDADQPTAGLAGKRATKNEERRAKHGGFHSTHRGSPQRHDSSRRASGRHRRRLHDAGVRLLVFPGRPAREVQGAGREQPSAHDRAARAARRHVRSQRQGAGREPQLVHDLDRPRAHEGSRSHGSRAVARSPASIRRTCTISSTRHRREPTYRPIVVVDDASLAQVAAVLARRLDTELPDVLVEEVPTRRYPTDSIRRASVRLRRRGERRAGRERRAAERRHRRAGRRREDLQQAADGRGRRAPRRRQQHGPRNPTLERDSRARRTPRAADDRHTICSTPPKTASRPAASTARRW